MKDLDAIRKAGIQENKNDEREPFGDIVYYFTI